MFTLAATATSLIYVINGGAWPALAAPGIVPSLRPLIMRYTRKPERLLPETDPGRLTRSLPELRRQRRLVTSDYPMFGESPARRGTMLARVLTP